MSLLGVEPSDEHKAVLRGLGNGECIFRDLDGRAGRIGVDLISDELRRCWTPTRPVPGPTRAAPVLPPHQGAGARGRGATGDDAASSGCRGRPSRVARRARDRPATALPDRHPRRRRPGGSGSSGAAAARPVLIVALAAGSCGGPPWPPTRPAAPAQPAATAADCGPPRAQHGPSCCRRQTAGAAAGQSAAGTAAWGLLGARDRGHRRPARASASRVPRSTGDLNNICQPSPAAAPSPPTRASTR